MIPGVPAAPESFVAFSTFRLSEAILTLVLPMPRKEVMTMADRRAGKGPYVRDEGGGKQPRSRNQDGTWRKKRSDAGTTKKKTTK